jgi:aspartyl-tRNA(Asn)/glutamyl-tRNA(Gln) amidotransferase subunit C
VLTEKDIQRIALLSRIEVTPTDVNELSNKLNGIFKLTEEMRVVDTTGIEPMNHAMDVVQRLREDKVTESNQRERLLAIAPQTDAGLYSCQR